MATGDSVIRVSIIGDVSKLTKAIGQANQSTGGLLKSTATAVGGTILAFGAVNKATEFIGDSLQEADRLGDAMSRLNHQIGPQFTDRLKDTADNFTRIGASTQDMLELEAIFADFGTAAGIADPQIASLAESVAATATALSQTDDQGRPAATILDLIDKAAAGSEKAARELGVTLKANIDPTQQLVNILGQLKPKLDDATTGTQDLESKQKELGARIEILQGQLGQDLAPAFEWVLGFIVAIIDDIPQLIDDFQNLGEAIEHFARTVLGPLGNVADALGAINSALTKGQSNLNGRPFSRNDPGGTTSDSGIQGASNRNADRNGTVRDRIGGP